MTGAESTVAPFLFLIIIIIEPLYSGWGARFIFWGRGKYKRPL